MSSQIYKLFTSSSENINNAADEESLFHFSFQSLEILTVGRAVNIINPLHVLYNEEACFKVT